MKPSSSNIFIFPSRHLRVAELINYWTWRGWHVATDRRGRLKLWRL